jgi:hypothetical protein
MRRVPRFSDRTFRRGWHARDRERDLDRDLDRDRGAKRRTATAHSEGMRTAATVICSLGHAATTHELLRLGITDAQLRVGMRAGDVVRAVRGVYLCGHADRDQKDAAAAHARITCLSALRRAGVANC